MQVSEAQFRLGRTPRGFDARIPHFSALVAGKTLPVIPPAHDWSTGMPSNTGMMLNDSLGDCTCAAVYHARQVWSFNTGQMITEPDADVELLYEKACGYKPSQGGEGPGGNEQHVLTYLLKQGAPTGTGQTVDKISAFVEVDPRNLDDVKRTIYACGVAYIGFNVPANIMPSGSVPPKIWTVDKAQEKNIIGGHAVVLVGYDNQYAKLISWGSLYQMTWQFFSTFVDEVYAIADDEWFTSKKTDPLGLTLTQLEQQMQALKGS